MGDIPAPMGFTKVDAPKGSFAEYTWSLPLKARGSKVKYFTGGDARLQLLAASVIDMPLLIVEGNTPARDIHVLRNPFFFSNPWYIVDPAKPGSTWIEKGYAMKNGGVRTYK